MVSPSEVSERGVYRYQSQGSVASALRRSVKSFLSFAPSGVSGWLATIVKVLIAVGSSILMPVSVSC